MRPVAVVMFGALAPALVFSASAQQADQPQQPATAATAQTSAPTQNPGPSDASTQASTPNASQQPAPAATQQPVAPESMQPAPASAVSPAPATVAKPAPAQGSEITEAEVKQLLVGKQLFLLGGYLNDNLSFNEHGVLIGRSPAGSYTLNAIQIDRVKLTKHKVELEGSRYALRFLGALPYEEIGKSVDRVKITPNKKLIRITIDREMVVVPKKAKEGKSFFGKSGKSAPATKPATAAAKPAAHAQAEAPPAVAANPAPAETGATPAEPTAATTTTPAPSAATSTQAETPAVSAANTAATITPTVDEPSEAEQLKAAIAAAPAAEKPADPKSVTTTTSPAHANKVFKDAVDKIFAQGFDDQLMASLPGFWKLYYQAVAAKSDYRPSDPAVMRQNTVDKKARLLTFTDPVSNEYAQANGVAGMALYHTVVGADGKAADIAVGRPIGFGLDENAVDAIRKATFEPATYDGKPVPVLLDMVVEFHIYSKVTSAPAKPGQKDKPEEPSLPGPYSRQEQQ